MRCVSVLIFIMKAYVAVFWFLCQLLKHPGSCSDLPFCLLLPFISMFLIRFNTVSVCTHANVYSL